jgi:cytochrome c oxidase cbb3-type subunit III
VAEHDNPEGIVHVYDDIQEADAQLPRWWLYCLFGTIIFAVGYWFVFQVFRVGDPPVLALQKELAAEREAALRVAVSPELILAASQDPLNLAEGKKIYETTCQACHAPGGAGNIGPNLTDKFWLHGGAPERIYTTVRDGVLDKGMPAWGPQLGADRVKVVTAYLLTLKGTELTGKAPQGTQEN